MALLDSGYILALLAVGVVFLVAGYKIGGEVFERRFNRIGAVTNTGIVS